VATGTAKMTVMAMIITRRTLSALSYPRRNKGFSCAIFIVAPGLTVKEEVVGVAAEEPRDNYYGTFSLCPNERLVKNSAKSNSGIRIGRWRTTVQKATKCRCTACSGNFGLQRYRGHRRQGTSRLPHASQDQPERRRSSGHWARRGNPLGLKSRTASPRCVASPLLRPLSAIDR